MRSPNPTAVCLLWPSGISARNASALGLVEHVPAKGRYTYVMQHCHTRLTPVYDYIST